MSIFDEKVLYGDHHAKERKKENLTMWHPIIYGWPITKFWIWLHIDLDHDPQSDAIR